MRIEGSFRPVPFRSVCSGRSPTAFARRPGQGFDERSEENRGAQRSGAEGVLDAAEYEGSIEPPSERPHPNGANREPHTRTRLRIRIRTRDPHGLKHRVHFGVGYWFWCQNFVVLVPELPQ
jgi:hypothetical protein